MMFISRALHNLTPVNLRNMFSEYNTNYGLRNFNNSLNHPWPRTKYLKCSFYNGAVLWTTLSQFVHVY